MYIYLSTAEFLMLNHYLMSLANRETAELEIKLKGHSKTRNKHTKPIVMSFFGTEIAATC